MSGPTCCLFHWTGQSDLAGTAGSQPIGISVRVVNRCVSQLGGGLNSSRFLTSENVLGEKAFSAVFFGSVRTAATSDKRAADCSVSSAAAVLYNR